jgi:hypothetical protein
MISQLELRSRAALCKQLAEREPANRVFWMAEAENWLRLVKKDSAASQSGPGALTATIVGRRSMHGRVRMIIRSGASIRHGNIS